MLVTKHNCLLTLDHGLNLLKTIGDHGSKPGEFNISWGSDEQERRKQKTIHHRIYRCDPTNNWIQKLDVDGGFLLEWHYEGKHLDQLYYPHFISVGGNRVAMSDQLNNRTKFLAVLEIIITNQLNQINSVVHLESVLMVMVISKQQIMIIIVCNSSMPMAMYT